MIEKMARLIRLLLSSYERDTVVRIVGLVVHGRAGVCELKAALAVLITYNNSIVCAYDLPAVLAVACNAQSTEMFTSLSPER